MVANIIQVKILNFLPLSRKTYKNIVKGGKKCQLPKDLEGSNWVYEFSLN